MLSIVLSVILVLWGCSSSGASGKRVRYDSGKIIIALLDTGVSTNAIDSKYLLPGYNYVEDSENTEDLINHGTAVASAIVGSEKAGIKGAASKVCLVPLVVVTKQDGEMTGASPEILAKAIQDSVDVYNADIINVSLGIYKEDSVLLDAVEYAEEKGVLIVSAVGNNGLEAKSYYPAAYPTVLAAGSCDRDGRQSVFTQNGADVLAPGEDIWLASRNGKTYGARGTSYASGYVSAMAANLLIEKISITPKELREAVIQKALSCGGYLPIAEE